MNSTTSLMLVALVAIVGTMSIASEAHAENHANLPLTIEADKSSYGHDSTITVTGQVANVIPGKCTNHTHCDESNGFPCYN